MRSNPFFTHLAFIKDDTRLCLSFFSRFHRNLSYTSRKRFYFKDYIHVLFCATEHVLTVKRLIWKFVNNAFVSKTPFMYYFAHQGMFWLKKAGRCKTKTSNSFVSCEKLHNNLPHEKSIRSFLVYFFEIKILRLYEDNFQKLSKTSIYHAPIGKRIQLWVIDQNIEI